MRWISSLERKFPRFRIPHLTYIILGGMLLVWAATLMTNPDSGFALINFISLDRAAILRGEVWRLVTFVFEPPALGFGFNALLGFVFIYYIGTNLEQRWSSFRFTLYFLMGMFCAILAMLITGFGSNMFLQLSFFLAFASIQPDQRLMLFFVIPIKAKWLAFANIAMLAFNVITSFFVSPLMGVLTLIQVLFSLVPFIFFFGPAFWQDFLEHLRIQKNRRQWQQKNK